MHVEFVRLWAEFFGSLILLLIGCLGATQDPAKQLQTSIHFGLVVMMISHCFGYISGAHANPCITIASTLLGNLPKGTASVYIIVQHLGAVSGYAIATQLIPEKMILQFGSMCMPSATVVSVWQAYGIECVLTMVVVFGWCAATDERNSAANSDASLMAVGIIVTACGLAGGQYTGAAMNPLRVLAPAFALDNYEYVGVYLCAHLTATTIVVVSWQAIWRNSGALSSTPAAPPKAVSDTVRITRSRHKKQQKSSSPNRFTS